MDDFLHQADYRGESDEQPIENVTSMIRLLAQLGVDSVRSFSILVEADPPPVWGHLPCARSCSSHSHSAGGLRNALSIETYGFGGTLNAASRRK